MPKLLLLLYFIINSSFISINAELPRNEICKSYELTYSTEKLNDMYLIVVDVKDNNDGPFRYMFYDEQGKHVTKGFEYKSNEVKVPKTGIYHAVVYDNKGCSSKLKIKISE